MPGILHRHRSRSVLWATLLVAVLARGLVPAGVMVGPDAAGHLALIACPGTAPAAVQAGTAPHHHPAPDGDAAHWHGSCAFALSELAAPPPPVPA